MKKIAKFKKVNQEIKLNKIKTPRHKLLTTEEAANYLGLKVKFMANARSNGGGPEYLKIQGLVKYMKVDLMKWVRSHKKYN